MKATWLFLMLSAGCGYGPVTNDALLGTWIAGYTDGALTMVLQPGPTGVYGTVTDSSPEFGDFTVTTLPDYQLRWTAPDGGTQDLYVRIVPYCYGEPLPIPTRVYTIDVTYGRSQESGGFRFNRDAPPPSCAVDQAPP